MDGAHGRQSEGARSEAGVGRARVNAASWPYTSSASSRCRRSASVSSSAGEGSTRLPPLLTFHPCRRLNARWTSRSPQYTPITRALLTHAWGSEPASARTCKPETHSGRCGSSLSGLSGICGLRCVRSDPARLTGSCASRTRPCPSPARRYIHGFLHRGRPGPTDRGHRAPHPRS